MALTSLLLMPWGAVTALLWGLVWGSFANVVIYRLPAGLSVVSPGSRCSSCATPLSPLDNIPLLSYLFLRGRCRHCGASYSPRYAFVEALMGGLTLLLYLTSPLRHGHPTALLPFLFHWCFLFLLVVITFIDWDTFIIPNVLVIPALFLALPATVLLQLNTLDNALLGLLLGYGLFWSVTTIYRLLRHREGLGLGDAKLLGVIGIVLGPLGVAPVILLASLQGVLFALVATLFRLSWPTPKPYKGISDDPAYGALLDQNQGETWRLNPIPFGPFLSLAAVEVLLLKPHIMAFLEGWFHP